MHFGGKGRYLVESVTVDGDRLTIAVRNAVPQRNGRWKISSTVRVRDRYGAIYLVTEVGPVSRDPCD